MKIFIPTRDRPVSPTGERLAKAGIPFTYVTSGTPCGLSGIHLDTKNIGEKRAAIMKMAGAEKVVQLDDDLSFFERVDDVKFVPISDDGLHRLFKTLDRALDYTAIAGIVSRFMANTTPRGLMRRGRFHQLLAYNPSLFKSNPLFRFPLGEEHDFTLQVYAEGWAPIILTEFAKSDKKPYSPGGCSAWRTPELELEIHHKIAEAHPGLVKVVPHPRTISGTAFKFNWMKATPEPKEQITFEELQ